MLTIRNRQLHAILQESAEDSLISAAGWTANW